MSLPVSSAIDNPISFSHANPINGLPFSVANGVRGEAPNVGGLFPAGESDVQYRPNAHTGDNVAFSQAPITQSYGRDGIWKPEETEDYAPLFLSRNKHSVIPGREVSQWIHPHQMYSMMYMNYKLKHDPEWLERYGKEQTCERILRDWSFIGIQKGGQYHENESERLVPGHFQTVYVGLRAPMRDLFAAAGNEIEGSAVQEGDHVGFVLRRYCREIGAQQAFKKKRDIAGNAKGEVVYFWQFDPWISPFHQHPDPSIYTYPGDNADDPYDPVNDDTRWVGHYIPFGLVVEYNGNSERAGDFISIARQALYPTPITASSTHKEMYRKLPKVVLLLRV